jgi:hypothetical protein
MTEQEIEQEQGDQRMAAAKLLREDAARLLSKAHYAEVEAACWYDAQGMSGGDRQSIYYGWLDEVRPILAGYSDDEIGVLLERTTTQD